MSQTWVSNCFQGSHAGLTDMANMLNNFACLKSNFSGGTAPSIDLEDFQVWGDTSKKVFKYNNPVKGESSSDDTIEDWLGVLHTDDETKHIIWFFNNNAIDGWLLHTGVSDCVLAVKGGTSYVNGGVLSGDFDISPQIGHNHQWINYDVGTGVQKVYDSSGSLISITYIVKSPGYEYSTVLNYIYYYGAYVVLPNVYTSDIMSFSGTEFRPTAAVGTLQHLDM